VSAAIKEPSKRGEVDGGAAVAYGRAVFRAVPFLAACLVGCSGVPFLVPDTRTAADHAHEIAPRCKDFPEDSVAPMLAPNVIDAVEPAYSYVNSGPVDREPRLRGARIRIKPLAGFSKETIARSVECHESRVVLGQASAPPDDPYVLPGHWLDIDVESEGDGFSVFVRSDEMDTARQVLARAQRYASATPVR
jgi:hypothetical protein